MIVLKNGRLVELSPARYEPGQDIVIEADRICAVGPGLGARYPEAEQIDLEGMLVMPGLVCAHHHLYSVLSRGILAPLEPSPDFVSMLKNLWWRLDQVIDPEILKISALIGGLEAIRAGTTAVIDHHAAPGWIPGSLSLIKAVFEQIGLRGLLCYEVTDRYGQASTELSLQENRDFALEIQQSRENRTWTGLIEAAIGAHAPFTLSDTTLTRLAELIGETGRGLHIHVAEDRYDVSDSHYRFGLGPLERLARFGLLTDKTIGVHGVHLEPSEIDRLNEADAFLVHNPRSNMNNNVGYARQLVAAANGALGTDGLGSDMLAEMKFCYFKNRDAAGSFSVQAVADLVQRNNRILERYFTQSFGKIAPDYQADLVCVDYHEPTPLEADNLAGHLIFGMDSGLVDTVLVAGQVVLRHRQFNFDIQPYYEKARSTARSLWSALAALPDRRK